MDGPKRRWILLQIALVTILYEITQAIVLFSMVVLHAAYPDTFYLCMQRFQLVVPIGGLLRIFQTDHDEGLKCGGEDGVFLFDCGVVVWVHVNLSWETDEWTEYGYGREVRRLIFVRYDFA